MRQIGVSVEVFAKIWSLREAGEQSEDDILRRLLDCSAPSQLDIPIPEEREGFEDLRYGAAFSEGFEIFRSYKGRHYRAKVVQGRWYMEERFYDQVNHLSRAVAKGTENAWLNWKYRDEEGTIHLINELRDPSLIARRTAGRTAEELGIRMDAPNLDV